MSRLLISPYSAVEATVRRHRPSHLLTLMSDPVVTPGGIPAGRHLRIQVDDIAQPIEGNVAPCADHVSDILAFARSWDREAPFLVHCWAGISRSTAAAFVVLCDIHGPGHEHVIARALRFRAPHAYPNRLIVRHADEMLARDGRMIEAVAAMGEGRIVAEGEVVELPLRLDEL